MTMPTQYLYNTARGKAVLNKGGMHKLIQLGQFATEHRSWNAWNVSLWLNNDEDLYRMAQSFVHQYGLGVGAVKLAQALRGEKTPDGATYNPTSIREALRDIHRL